MRIFSKSEFVDGLTNEKMHWSHEIIKSLIIALLQLEQFSGDRLGDVWLLEDIKHCALEHFVNDVAKWLHLFKVSGVEIDEARHLSMLEYYDN